MKNLLRTFLLGILLGVLIGWRLAEQKQQRDEQARAEAFNNDPEIIALRKERARDRLTDAWLSEWEDENA
jgi:hypothetical protein